MRIRSHSGAGRFHLGLLSVCLVLAACTAPIKLKPAQPDSSAVRPVESLRGVDSLSRETQQLLRLYALEDKLPRYPTAVVAVLRGLRGSSLAHVALAAEAEVAILAALNTLEAAVTEAANWYLLAASRAYEFMFGGDDTPIKRAMDPRFQRMRRVYNVSVASYVGLLRQTLGGIRDHEQATRFELFQVDLDLEDWRLNPQQADELLVARQLEIRGLRNRYRRDGLGAALVAYRSNRLEDPQDRFYSPEGRVDPVTAVMEFGPRVAGIVGQARFVKLSFYDPRDTDAISIGELEVPLQADLTTHLAYLASLTSGSGVGRKALLNPEEWTERMGLYLLEEYDPNKIPLITVHGLKSSPLAWMELINDIYGDRQLHERFQVWQFFYPTALPYLYVGRILRNKLEEIRVELDPEGDDPAMGSMVIVAHSMGGLVSRSLISDSGSKIWDVTFKVPPEQVRGTPQDVQWLREMLEFEHEPFIDRVIFVATPHRGADRAGGLIGQVGSSMVDLPEAFLERAERIRVQNQDLITSTAAEMMKKGPPDSIRARRPDNPVLRVFGSLPIAPGIRYHTIMGNRGRGPEEPISDGWVDYESVHLEGAESELIVPAPHAAYAHAATTAEIRRILHLHLRQAE